MLGGNIRGYVDLGIPSGMLWAIGNIVKDSNGKYSIGAETDWGTYVSWGNIDGHNEDEGYNFNSINYNTTPGYTLTADIPSSDSAHDICLARLGTPWRLPTNEDFQELYDNTDREWTTFNDVSGWKFMKKTDHSLYVFFPAAGLESNTTLNHRGTYGYYWSSSIYEGGYSLMMNFGRSFVSVDGALTDREWGLSVRSICKPMFSITITLEGEDVEGIAVTVTDSDGISHSGTTDFNGVARISGVSNGEAKISVNGYYLLNSDIQVNASNRSFTIIAVHVYDFSFTGEHQSQMLEAGTYKIECWGAQGGSYNSTYYGGKGGYSVGKLILNENTTVYVYVGGKGTDGITAGEKTGGFNGGGKSYTSGSGYEAGSGGGASDVRIGQDSLYARVIVAGGGGGAGAYNSSNRYSGGAGGGTSGVTPSQYNTSYKSGEGGSQTSRGTSHYYTYTDSTTYVTLADFGVGSSAISGKTFRITGGGGGWYGGGSGGRAAGGGGSGYVYTADTASNYPSGCLLNSSYYLTNAETITGDQSFPAPSGGTEVGHEGNGLVRITKLS